MMAAMSKRAIRNQAFDLFIPWMGELSLKDQTWAYAKCDEWGTCGVGTAEPTSGALARSGRLRIMEGLSVSSSACYPKPREEIGEGAFGVRPAPTGLQEKGDVDLLLAPGLDAKQRLSGRRRDDLGRRLT